MSKPTFPKPTFAIYTSGFDADPHDSDIAQIIRHAHGRTEILFDNGDTYWSDSEELEVIV